ncbi:hypothetical protein CBER1_10316 [Cercospora berteroae]|uniref:Heterokaryon incompatibility domain-containing protein n=1 Tax=Cercospora berteroae TaxID=357750 RepID=A0A2S6BY97_9PEZI|nr:hypothetical protein CBER1_10316 [Cercospora berteroae]
MEELTQCPVRGILWERDLDRIGTTPGLLTLAKVWSEHGFEDGRCSREGLRRDSKFPLLTAHDQNDIAVRAPVMSTPRDSRVNADTDTSGSATASSPEPRDRSSEANSDSSKPDVAYSPVPLQDLKNQIRLLSFVSAAGRSPLELQTSVGNLHEAPPYVGISYAWGKDNTRTVVINGEPARIRYNAYYALRQVQLHYRQIHIWIDTICINQNDDVEKSAQVAMMYEIFEGATYVVSSLGAEFEDAEWLFTVEAAAARDDVELLSGPHHISAIAMRSFIYAVDPLKDPQQYYPGASHELLVFVGQEHYYRPPFDLNLRRLNGFHCSDPRDRLFAIVGITNWEKSDCPRIIPDYTKSAWDLALEMAPLLTIALLQTLVRALEITSETEEVVSLIVRTVSGINERVVALVCPDAGPDDILFPMWDFSGLLLIVRESNTKDGRYDIIGQGLLIQGYGYGKVRRGSCPAIPCTCSPEFFARQSVFMADVHVTLTTEELIVLEAQQRWGLDNRE